MAVPVEVACGEEEVGGGGCPGRLQIVDEAV